MLRTWTGAAGRPEGPQGPSGRPLGRTEGPSPFPLRPPGAAEKGQVDAFWRRQYVDHAVIHILRYLLSPALGPIVAHRGDVVRGAWGAVSEGVLRKRDARGASGRVSGQVAPGSVGARQETREPAFGGPYTRKAHLARAWRNPHVYCSGGESGKDESSRSFRRAARARDARRGAGDETGGSPCGPLRRAFGPRRCVGREARV